MAELRRRVAANDLAYVADHHQWHYGPSTDMIMVAVGAGHLDMATLLLSVCTAELPREIRRLVKKIGVDVACVLCERHPPSNVKYRLFVTLVNTYQRYLNIELTPLFYNDFITSVRAHQPDLSHYDADQIVVSSLLGVDCIMWVADRRAMSDDDIYELLYAPATLAQLRELAARPWMRQLDIDDRLTWKISICTVTAFDIYRRILRMPDDVLRRLRDNHPQMRPAVRAAIAAMLDE